DDGHEEDIHVAPRPHLALGVRAEEDHASWGEGAHKELKRASNEGWQLGRHVSSPRTPQAEPRRLSHSWTANESRSPPAAATRSSRSRAPCSTAWQSS